jgi:hypothetical protein
MNWKRIALYVVVIVLALWVARMVAPKLGA